MWKFTNDQGQVCNFVYIHVFNLIFNRMLVESGHVSHDPKMRTFTVTGSSDKPHVVRLHPEYCSCPATATCYHIIAVRLSVGMPVSSESKKINLTQLKRNTKAKGNRISGRKRPRPSIDNYYI